jgi:hypothetical protein
MREPAVAGWALRSSSGPSSFPPASRPHPLLLENRALLSEPLISSLLISTVDATCPYILRAGKPELLSHSL